MNKHKWSGRSLLKYILIQLPAIAALVCVLMLVKQWVEIPSWLMWGLIMLWIVKDAILYPFVWRAYDWGSQEEKAPMIGLRGISKDRLDPSGYIFVRGELWKAKVIEEGPEIEKGENVIIQGVRGLTLFVEHETKQKDFDQTKNP